MHIFLSCKLSARNKGLNKVQTYFSGKVLLHTGSQETEWATPFICPQKYYKGAGEEIENFVLQAHQQTQRNSADALLCLHILTYIHMKAHNGGISCTFYPINTVAGCRANEGLFATVRTW